MDLPTRDGDGYLTDINDWTPEVGHEMARMDGVEMTDQKWEHILAAREMYEDRQTVPPIRKLPPPSASRPRSFTASGRAAR